MVPTGTNISFTYKGTDGSYNTDSTANKIGNEDMNQLFDKERLLVSRSNEKANMSNNKSTFVYASLTTSSVYLSPVVDLRRKDVIVVENIINNDLTNETYTYGNALSKYISKKVVLADGQDAEDISVTLAAYRPVNSDIQVYVKFAAASDPEQFDTKAWTQLSYAGGGNLTYSSGTDVTNYIDYDFVMPSASATTVQFSGNTAVSNTAETITFTSTPFTNNQLVYYYTSAGSTPPSGLANNTFYYVVNTTSTSVQLSASMGGSPINLTSSTDNPSNIGHYLRGYNSATAHSAFLNNDNLGILEYYNNTNSRMSTFKNFQIKIVMLSSDRVNIPRISTLRAIALQK